MGLTHDREVFLLLLRTVPQAHSELKRLAKLSSPPTSVPPPNQAEEKKD